MAEPHPYWVARGRWGSPTTYLLVRRSAWSGVLRFYCGQCGRGVLRDAKACYEESFVAGVRPFGCGATFTQITTPFEDERGYAERARPDLEYVVKAWC